MPCADPLTGLPNRTVLIDRLSHGIYEAGRYGRHFGLFFVDLDGFSTVNNALGYEWGDAVLRAVAQGLNDTVRAGDTLARLENDDSPSWRRTPTDRSWKTGCVAASTPS